MLRPLEEESVRSLVLSNRHVGSLLGPLTNNFSSTLRIFDNVLERGPDMSMRMEYPGQSAYTPHSSERANKTASLHAIIDFKIMFVDVFNYSVIGHCPFVLKIIRRATVLIKVKDSQGTWRDK